MGVVIESETWEPSRSLFVCLFFSCLVSILCLPNKVVTSALDHAPPPSLLRFQRNFLLLYSLTSVIEGSWAVFGEYELGYYGLSKDQILTWLCLGHVASLFVGSFLGMVSDIIGHRKMCLFFYILHLLVNLMKITTAAPAIWLASIFLSLASSIFFSSFETWMIVEHEKLGQRQDSLNDMFWLMLFFGSASLIGSQVLANHLIDGSVYKNITSVRNGVLVLAIVAVICVTRGWKEAPPPKQHVKDYEVAFRRHIVSDKRIWLLSWAQACVHFSVVTFWILWAPTIVADGREVTLGLIYPCLLGSKMLGSTIFPWFSHGPLAIRTEEYLAYALVVMGVALSIIAYDYQEIGVLVSMFSLYQASLGMVLPSLARLRTMYVPNEVRGGMMSLSLVPACAAALFFLFLRANNYIANSTIIAFSSIGLFSAAYCMYTLRKWGKLHQTRHNL